MTPHPTNTRFTYGPVPSRRLGRSLGVSIIPRKTCTNSCVYCQLGHTRKRSVSRRSFFPREEVLDEIQRIMKETSPDCITFVGDGEPTLSTDLGWYLEQCKRRWPTPVAVITNGCLLHRAEVRTSLRAADIVLPSLDAGDAETFQAINRPHPTLDFHEVVEGLIEFRRDFPGAIRLEVMLVRGINDSESNLRSIRKLAWGVKPDRIDIAVPIRPPADRSVLPPDPDKLIRAHRLFRSAETLDRAEDGAFEIAGFTTLADAIIGLSSRHPLRWDQAKKLEVAFGKPGQLESLVSSGALSVSEYGETRFVVPSTGKGIES
ncbi:radical SAM protein [bacterium]|nr:radical SAM protein [bacterium]